jgi:transposase
MKAISQAKRNDILAALQNEKKESQRALAKRFGVSVGTINAIAKENEITTANNTGRPSKFTTYTGRKVYRLVNTGKAKNAKAVARVLQHEDGLQVHPQTVRNLLKENGMVSRLQQVTSGITPAVRKKRLKFAHMYKHWTEDDWATVAFADESRFNLNGSDGRQYVWTPKGERLREHCMIRKKKYGYSGGVGGSSIMVWACVMAAGPGNLVNLSGYLDAKYYVEILEDDFKKSLAWYEMDIADTHLLQDSDSKHKAKICREWYEENNVQLMYWPTYSPDLNPIENVWARCKQLLAEHEHPAKGVKELWKRLEDVWNSKEIIAMCKSSVNSMPRRCRAVIAAKGDKINY